MIESAGNQRKMAALISGIFWLNFCTVGGSGDAVPSFFTVGARDHECLWTITWKPI